MSGAHNFDLNSLDPFFMPESLAVIGATEDPRKLGGRPVLSTKKAGFRGKIYPINPHASEVFGVRAYPSLEAVEDAVECAYISLPAIAVEDAVRACAKKGVRAAIIVSVGFAEADEEGRARQARIVEIARGAGMRLLGPNCMGVMNIARGAFLAFLSVFDDQGRKSPRLGDLSLVSQSGAFGAHAYELALKRGLGFSKWITTGNQCDVELAECIAYYAEDADTKGIMVYMEGVPAPEKLLRALRLARDKRKPVVLLKSGSSEIGSQAALSHTGSLTGSDLAFDAVCSQYGVHRARTIDELLDIAVAISHGKYPTKAQVGLVSISGGVGALMTDYADELGLAVPALPADAQATLLKMFSAGSARNPIDPTGLWTRDVTVFSASLRALFKEGRHEAVVVFLSTACLNPVFEPKIREQILAVRQEFPERLIIVSMLGSGDVLAEWRRHGLLVFEEPRRALEVVAALVKFASKVISQAPEKTSITATLPATTIARKLTEHEASNILERAGIPFATRILVDSRVAAERAAIELGFPVVLKLVSADIAHKSEIGGVLTNLTNRQEVGRAYELIMERAKEAAPNAHLHSALVARQVVGGIETVIGASQDPVVGPVLMVGIGGIFVDVYKDVVFRAAPVSVAEAHAMIREIKGYAILNGARGTPPADHEALAQAISNLSRFAVANIETIKSIDINPLIVLPAGQGVFGVDAFIEAREQ